MTSAPSRSSTQSGLFDLVIVSNRLPVDRIERADGGVEWRTSPGGLVAALEPMMRSEDGVWIGWAGAADLELEPQQVRGIDIVPITLSAQEVEEYYEGFSNGTLWPLYHDVIAPPGFHREWWDSYVTVNARFADAAARYAAAGAVVWVHDYQLQLVPAMLRKRRPDLVIGFFDHIPFPSYGLFAQLPWRRQIVEGVLGADVIGFQRSADAHNFIRVAKRLTGVETRGSLIEMPLDPDEPPPTRHIATSRRGSRVRTIVAKQFPISIDSATFVRLAADPDIQRRAQHIREELGNPKTIMLGVDRLDYTKGIGHRLKAYGELLRDGAISPDDTALIQVASPSRERVDSYRQLRDEIEMTVGRINGEYSTIGHLAVTYLHHGYPRDEMVALYLASDVMLVTSLRDGMNLVAKEYVASRTDGTGALVLSEFTGAADELKQALQVNPHDIDGLKAAIMQAINMPERDRRRRMRLLRKRVLTNDVAAWSALFFEALTSESHAELVRPRSSPTRTGSIRAVEKGE